MLDMRHKGIADMERMEATVTDLQKATTQRAETQTRLIDRDPELGSSIPNHDQSITSLMNPQKEEPQKEEPH